MLSIWDLHPQAQSTIRRVIRELASYKRRFRTSRSTPITLGSGTPVIINPSQKDTENNVPDDMNNFLHKWPDRRFFRKEKDHT